MFDWDEGDRFSFEDSDRFEEDSLCSWISEPESSCNNWRGWKKQQSVVSIVYHPASHPRNRGEFVGDGQVASLVELSARVVAFHIPFEVVEHVCPPVPEQLQLRIAFWSFPENEEDIRLYSCLANGSADEFQRGEHLYKARAVKELLQIGFHLSATIMPPQPAGVQGGKGHGCNVAVTFDRCRVTSCACTCSSAASWCSHVVAVCLHRIHQPSHVRLRAPVSESLSRLHRVQLQKFAQYLISELPQQILPTAQRLLDELLSSQQTAINTLGGAPDPTAGASINEQTTWCLDNSTLHDNIRKILIKLCVPSPIVFSDVNYLSSTAPPAAAEWASLLRPLRGREPEGLWNLLSIVREMFHRSDRNAIPLLEILTEEVLQCDQILSWWFSTKVSLHVGSSGGHGGGRGGGGGSVHSNTHASQHACSSLCDEVVVLWRLAALNPALSPQDRQTLFGQLRCWHVKTLERVWKTRSGGGGNSSGGGLKRTDIEVFPGFRPAMEGCLLDWSDYPIPGVTYAEGGGRRWYCPYVHVRTSEPSASAGVGGGGGSESDGGSFSSRRGRSVDVGQLAGWCPCEHDGRRNLCMLGFHQGEPKAGGSNRSSLSSEGFCENEQEVLAEALSESRRTSSSRQAGPSATGGAWSSQEEPSEDKDHEDEDKEEPLFATPPRPNAQKANGLRRGDCPESRPPGDEYHLYYYDPRARVSGAGQEGPRPPPPEEQWFSVAVKKIEDPLEVLFARAEALHAHGHSNEACMLAVRLAEELLASPPDLTPDSPAASSSSAPTTNGATPSSSSATSCRGAASGGGKKGRSPRFDPAHHRASLLASATLAKAAFLCSVLGESSPEHHALAFRVGLFGLEVVRPPASTKALEVKLANQEQELALLLKRLPLTEREADVIRDRAESLRAGKPVSRGEALLPLTLASFLFDALAAPSPPAIQALGGMQNRSMAPAFARLPGDEQLGFDAAVAALGLKANVSEAEHPLLCEGTRRQRGDLAITLLVTYKDDQEKLAKIMEKLLDKEVHQMYKAPTSSLYYSSSSSSTAASTSTAGAANGCATGEQGTDRAAPEERSSTPGEEAAAPGDGDGPDDPEGPPDLQRGANERRQNGTGRPRSLPSAQNGNRTRQSHRSGGMDDAGEQSEGASSPGWEEDYKAWEAKFRCTNFRTNKKQHSAGMASIDSSAPETTSSDNSPTVVRRSHWLKGGSGPGSDSGSSGESSDSFASSSSSSCEHPPPQAQGGGPAPPKAAKAREQSGIDSIPALMLSSRLSSGFGTSESNVRSNTPSIKNTRFKGKRGGAYPSLPNQPSEAGAHFMFELAKTVLTKAGGSSSTAVLFTTASAGGGQNHRGPHRALHLCAFQIGLYALGLHNAVSPNWLSRTYSSHVSWITGQAMEIGSTAITFLIGTWEGHLTPPEVASLADRASRGRDPGMVSAAARLALSCLPHAHALNPNEIQRALLQCKEQPGPEMLERACLAVESAAKGGGVYPEVLFDVARRWYELYEESLDDNHHCGSGSQLQDAHPNGVDPPTTTSSSVGGTETMLPPCEHLLAAPGPLHLEGAVIPSVQVLPPQLSYALAAYPNYGYVPFSPLHPAYVHPPPVTYPYAPALAYYPPVRGAGLYPPPGAAQVARAAAVAQAPQAPVLSVGGHGGVMSQAAPAPQAMPTPQQTQMQVPLPQLSQRQMGYLLAAYRVGMLAMETLARRVHDDRPQAKYARNPPYGEDVKWLLSIAKKLGTSYLQDFCICTVNSVASPFVLHEIVVEAAQYLALRSSPSAPLPLRSHLLTPLIQKCQQMFTACTHFKMYHITPAEYDEFVSIIRSARTAFQLTPGGMVQFNELLQSLRRTKSCKKELWQRIANTLAAPPTL
ncbi:zinc finger SWIM domain-containing protein 8-like [Uloborus diversus]|uniref:zinc finger SWIM domain-containing protein 8-like n=1 Tax=Uloborus diversus TaxID=327109 RepID=UPI00240A22C6|nr:zinc finger SWIM domain-containing protein 8-like [Uloborus diversus]